MTPRRVSLREVARLAGVSSGTASRVLSGSAYPVSEPTSARVREAAEALGYVTDFAARALVTGRSTLVGAIVHDITDPYFSGVVRGLQDEAVGEGLVVLVGNDDRDAAKLESYLTMMLSQKPAGVVLVGGQVRDPAKSLRVFRAVERLRSDGVPVAAVGRYELDIPHVAVDDASATGEAAAHLIGLGHSRVAFVGGLLDSTTIEDRYRGYVAMLNRAGVPVDDTLVVQTPMSLAGGSQAAETLVDRGAPFTAVIAATDEVAFGVISGLRERGLRIPQDVSVVGMDDVPMASHADPPLTTIRVPARELGCSAWRLLSAIRNGAAVPAAQCIPFDLVVRDSTAPPSELVTSSLRPSDRTATAARKDR
jgi:LacI family transcriptional regulator